MLLGSLGGSVSGSDGGSAGATRGVLGLRVSLISLSANKELESRSANKFPVKFL